jgi:hypothetical protein
LYSVTTAVEDETVAVMNRFIEGYKFLECMSPKLVNSTVLSVHNACVPGPGSPRTLLFHDGEIYEQ